MSEKDSSAPSWPDPMPQSTAFARTQKAVVQDLSPGSGWMWREVLSSLGRLTASLPFWHPYIGFLQKSIVFTNLHTAPASFSWSLCVYSVHHPHLVYRGFLCPHYSGFFWPLEHFLAQARPEMSWDHPTLTGYPGHLIQQSLLFFCNSVGL